MESSRAPAVVYREASLVGKLLRDLLTDEFQAIRIDSAAGISARARVDPAHPADARPAREAVLEALPDLRGVRRPGRDRQGAEEQGVAEVRRIDRHQPDRGAGGDRRQHRPLRRQEVGRPARGHHRQDQPRGGQGNRPAGPAPRPGRHHRPRLHRHGGEEEPPEDPPGGGAGAEEGPLAVEGAGGVGLRAA